jgi:hypothetical protein
MLDRALGAAGLELAVNLRSEPATSSLGISGEPPEDLVHEEFGVGLARAALID